MKKRIQIFLLYLIPTLLLISMLLLSFVGPLWFGEKISCILFIINLVLLTISYFVMLYGLDKLGVGIEDYKEFSKYKVEMKDKDNFLKELESNIKKLKYSKDCDLEYFKIYKKEEEKLNLIVVVKVEEFTKELYKKLLNDIGDYAEKIYGDEPINKSVNMIKILCVDRVNLEFKKFCYEQIDDTGGSLSLPIGISFGSKKLYIREIKSKSWDKELYEKQEEFKEIIFKLINATKIIEEKKE